MSTTFAKKNGSIVMVKDFDGILKATFEHEVKSIKGTLDYTGPCIPREVWYQVTSFFRWTYDTTKSESQVRLFLNPKAGTWLAWAFPQEARTGMTAKEIENDAFRRQRAELPDAADLIYLSTVHHHCSGSAFQSGTDHANEIGQDGIHITVGGMDKPHHDLHCRLYVERIEFAPDMSRFWDIGEAVREELPANLWDQIARHQMGRKVEVAFPEQWKNNLIEIKSESVQDWHAWNTPGEYGMGLGGNFEPEFKRVELAARAALEEMFEQVRDPKPEELFKTVEYLWCDKVVDLICSSCEKFKVVFEDVVQELHQYWDHHLNKVFEEVEPDPKEGKKGKGKKPKFKATHTIKGVDVLWDGKTMRWTRENGWRWDFDSSSWLDETGKPVKEENGTPGSSVPMCKDSERDGAYNID